MNSRQRRNARRKQRIEAMLRVRKYFAVNNGDWLDGVNGISYLRWMGFEHD